MNQLTKLQRQIQYEFNNVQLLKQALTHRSASQKHNERLEFLGDAILNYCIAEALFQQFPHCNEGELSRMRATLVREATLAELAHQFHLGEYMLLGSGELKSGGARRVSILADCIEAIIGAISLDQDFGSARQIIRQWYSSRLAEIKPGENQKDPKTRLQEYLQSKALPLPNYEVINIQGEAHCQTFTVKCEMNITKLTQTFIAKGTSRRKAEQAVAREILHQLEKK